MMYLSSRNHLLRNRWPVLKWPRSARLSARTDPDHTTSCSTFHHNTFPKLPN